MLAVTIGNDTIVAIASVGATVVALAVAYNSWLKDRGEKKEKEQAAIDDDFTVDREQIRQIRQILDHLVLTVIGRPEDKSTGLPGIDGFMQRQEAHNKFVDGELSQNGGGSVKDAVVKMCATVETLQGQVATLADQPGAQGQ